MITNQVLDCNFKIKSISENSGEFEGYGSVFDNVDAYGDVVAKGAFKESLHNWQEKEALPALLWQHKADEPIGYYSTMFEDEKGLYVKGRLLVEDDPLARRAFAHLKAGSLSGLSIGYTIDNKENCKFDNKTNAYILTKINLWEVSLVTFPANEKARIAEVKNYFDKGQTPPPSRIERVLRDVGFSRNQAKAFIKGGYNTAFMRDATNAQIEAIKALKQLTTRI